MHLPRIHCMDLADCTTVVVSRTYRAAPACEGCSPGTVTDLLGPRRINRHPPSALHHLITAEAVRLPMRPTSRSIPRTGSSATATLPAPSGPASITIVTMSQFFIGGAFHGSHACERENALPVVLHAYHRPRSSRRLVYGYPGPRRWLVTLLPTPHARAGQAPWRYSPGHPERTATRVRATGH